jgi:hypothetical protein
MNNQPKKNAIPGKPDMAKNWLRARGDVADKRPASVVLSENADINISDCTLKNPIKGYHAFSPRDNFLSFVSAGIILTPPPACDSALFNAEKLCALRITHIFNVLR